MTTFYLRDKKFLPRIDQLPEKSVVEKLECSALASDDGLGIAGTARVGDEFFVLDFGKCEVTHYKIRPSDACTPQTSGELVDAIASLEISERVKSYLLAHGITTISALTEMSENEVMKIPNIGKLARENIKEALAEHHLSFRRS